jgi:sulfite reductase beta subunit-like hemoprotein
MTKDAFDDVFGKHFGAPQHSEPSSSEHHYREYHGKTGNLEHFTYLARKLHFHHKGFSDAAGHRQTQDIHSVGLDQAHHDLNYHFFNHMGSSDADDAYDHLDETIRRSVRKGSHLSTQSIHDIWHNHDIESHLP